MLKKKEEKVSIVRVIPPKWYQNHHANQEKFTHSNFRKPPKLFTLLKKSQTQVYETLKIIGMLHPIKERPLNLLNKFYWADHKWAYHLEVIRHDMENCLTLKHKIQDMLDNKLIIIDEAYPNDNIFHT